jgi:hypothetical protein
MAIEVTSADNYVNAYVIANEDWIECEAEKKQRILNVASQVLVDKYEGYVVPDEAVYEYAATLATVFNDTNKMQQQGVAGFSVTGVGSFTFKENNVNSAAGQPLDEFITQRAKKIIEKANDGLVLSDTNVGWLV